jgi:hypothetical protein
MHACAGCAFCNSVVLDAVFQAMLAVVAQDSPVLEASSRRVDKTPALQLRTGSITPRDTTPSLQYDLHRSTHLRKAERSR